MEDKTSSRYYSKSAMERQDLCADCLRRVATGQLWKMNKLEAEYKQLRASEKRLRILCEKLIDHIIADVEVNGEKWSGLQGEEEEEKEVT